MEINYGKQIDISELSKQSIDLFIFACNHEQRVYSAFEVINENNFINKVVGLCYNNDIDRNLSCQADKVIVNSNDDIFELLNREILQVDKQELNIAIDYSCMTKSWYYSIILYLTKKILRFKSITAYFVYTPSKYSNPQDPKPNTDIAPLPGKYVVPTDKPKALIVCLGYEQNKAEGIIDHLDPKIAYLFYTDPALESKFVSTLKENNKNVLTDRAEFVVTYPFDNTVYLEKKLTSIYQRLKNDYSIIIAPIGPKPFTLISMLMSVKYPDIDIWRVGSGSDINMYERSPIDPISFIINKVVFNNQTSSLFSLS